MKIKKRDRIRSTAGAPADGWIRAAFFASDFTPCGCSTSSLVGIETVIVDWTLVDDRYVLRCTNCGAEWSRAAIAASGRRTGLLSLDASHPEERAARRARAIRAKETA